VAATVMDIRDMIKVEIDNWEGVRNTIVERFVSSIIDFDEILNFLDGKKHTQLSTEFNDFYFVIGGNNDEFVVTKIYKDQRSFTLHKIDNISNYMHNICVGGQYGDFSDEIVVSRKEALCAAADVYFSDCECQLKWIEDK
jgi:vacuolar-type H+-ATPase subunit C/Vma6